MIVKDCLQVRSKSLIRYNKFPRTGLSSLAKSKALSNFYRVDTDTGELQSKTYSGTLCAGAKKRLTRAIENCVMASLSTYEERPNGKILPFQLSFMTLTIHSPARMLKSKEVQKTCLERFLRWMREYHDLQLYVWKAELQKRGQVHYHIISNCYIDKTLFRDKWNSLLKEAGYLDQYFEKKGHYNAPSVDITSIKNKNNLSGYLSKAILNDGKKANKKNVRMKALMRARSNIVGEMAKDKQNLISVGGKVWDCCMNLKKYGYYTTELDGETKFKIDQAVKSGAITKIEKERCIIYRLVKVEAIAVLSYFTKMQFDGYLTDIRLKPIPLAEQYPPPKIKRTNIKIQVGLFSAS